MGMSQIDMIQKKYIVPEECRCCAFCTGGVTVFELKYAVMKTKNQES